MAVKHQGYKGFVTLPAGALAASTIYINAYNYNWEHELIDITLFTIASGQVNSRTLGGGISRLTGSCSGFLDDLVVVDLIAAGVIDAVAIAGFVLQQHDGGTPGTLTFDGMISSIAVDCQRTGPMTVVCNFESSGAVAVVDTVAPT